ncbi:MAG: serine/threonine protein kinase [Planctomyces sp.]|jgi:Tol biopolymer transport system component
MFSPIGSLNRLTSGLLLCSMVLSVIAPRTAASELFFTSSGKTGIIASDGTGLRYFDFDVPGQATWQPGPSFSDGRRVIFLSMEPRRDGPGKPFAEFYTQTPTHIWAHDLIDGSLKELCTEERIAPFETPALLIGDERLLVQVVKDQVGRIVSMKLDGSDPKDFTKAGEGLPYGFSQSPDGRRVAFHLAGSSGYQVMTANADGTDRTLIAAAPGHLYFGTSWSPSGEHILYVDCVPGNDPGHDWADVCIGKADGSDHRVLTAGFAMWFAATYGPADRHGSGSNLPAWTRDGSILFPRRSPGTQVPWQYRVGKPDLDHFNRDFRPDLAQGGVCISRLDPVSGTITDLTPMKAGIWDFRATESPDGRKIVYCRAATAESPEIRVINSDGTADRALTRGVDDLGADHPRWLPSRKQ